MAASSPTFSEMLSSIPDSVGSLLNPSRRPTTRSIRLCGCLYEQGDPAVNVIYVEAHQSNAVNEHAEEPCYFGGIEARRLEDEEADDDVLEEFYRQQPEERVFVPVEPYVRPVPFGPLLLPSDISAHNLILQHSKQVAQRTASQAARRSLLQGRCCLLGIFALCVLRSWAWCQSVTPGPVLFGIHWLSSTADAICMFSSAPFYIQGIDGRCVDLGCIGPVVTLIFSMCLADVGAFLAYMAIAAPRPLLNSSRSLLARLEAAIGVWELNLFASVAFQLALCATSWRIYCELRRAGLYPPGGLPVGLAKQQDVSLLEIVCEAEDAQVAEAACLAHCGGPTETSKAAVKTVEVIRPLERQRRPPRHQLLQQQRQQQEQHEQPLLPEQSKQQTDEEQQQQQQPESHHPQEQEQQQQQQQQQQQPQQEQHHQHQQQQLHQHRQQQQQQQEEHPPLIPEVLRPHNNQTLLRPFILEEPSTLV